MLPRWPEEYSVLVARSGWRKCLGLDRAGELGAGNSSQKPLDEKLMLKGMVPRRRVA